MVQIHKVNVTLDRFTGINSGNSYSSIKEITLPPLICNASRDSSSDCILQYNTQLKFLEFNLNNISNIRSLNITAHVSGPFTLQVANGHTKNINSVYNTEYFYGNLAKRYVENRAKEKYQVGADQRCKKTHFRIVQHQIKNISAIGSIIAFDSNNNDRTSEIQTQYPELSISPSQNLQHYRLHLNNITMTINSVLNYSSTDCTSTAVDLSLTNIPRPTLDYPKILCQIKPIILNGSGGVFNTTRQYVTKKMNGEITGVPHSDFLKTLGSVKEYHHDTSFNELQSSFNFVSSDHHNFSIVASVNKTSACPREELLLAHYKDHNKTEVKSIRHAAFESIRAVKLGFIEPRDFLLSWSIYLYDKQQFFILFDYISNYTLQDPLRIVSYDGKFSNIYLNPNKKFLVAYREKQYKLTIAKFVITESFFLKEKHIDIDVSSNHHTEFELIDHDDGQFSLVWSHASSKGIFIQKYSANLSKIGEQQNIICFPESVKVDIFQEHTAILWQELSKGSTQTQYFIQTIHNDTFIERKHLLNVIGARIKGIEILHLNSTLSDNQNLGYLIVMQNGTQDLGGTPIQIIYNATFDIQNIIRGELSLSLDGLNHQNHSNLSTIHNEIATHNYALANIKRLERDKINQMIATATVGASLLSSLATSSQGCNCECPVEEKRIGVKYKSQETEGAVQEIEKSAVKSEATLNSITRQRSKFFSSALKRIESIAKNGRYLKMSAVELFQKTGLKTVRNALAADVKVLGKSIPVVNIIFAAVFVVEEIINLSEENGIVSTQQLKLNFPSHSKIDGANPSQIDDLEQTLNFVHLGLSNTLPFISNVEGIESYRNFTDRLFCKNVITYNYIDDLIVGLIKLLEADLHYYVHTDTRGSYCRDDNNDLSFYPGYRVGNVAHLCPSYDDVDYDKACRRFIKVVKDASVFVLPFLFTNPFTAFLGSIVIGAIIEGTLTDDRIAELCHSHHQLSNGKLLHLSNALIAILTSDTPQKEISSDECHSLTKSGCNTLSDIAEDELCLSHFVTTTATAFNISQTFYNQFDDISLYCSHSCNLDDNAVDSLGVILVGYYD